VRLHRDHVALKPWSYAAKVVQLPQPAAHGRSLSLQAGASISSLTALQAAGLREPPWADAGNTCIQLTTQWK
jgi:hypothetical protein